MKVLVTGGAGFIGSNIVDTLIKNGFDVVIVDDLSTGKKENLNPKAVFYNVDLNSPELRAVFEKEQPDLVCHHAAQINVRLSLENPGFDSKTNILGSIALLELCNEFNVKKVVYASSGGAIYGDPEYLPCDESHPINPISPYAVSKYAVELFLNYYHKVHGLNYCVLRYSNVYGPRQDPKGEAGVISIFMDRLLENKECKINGDGNQTRDFVFVKDVARANLLALNSDCEACAINIGFGKETSINELFEKIKDVVGSSADAAHTDTIKGEVEKTYLKIDYAKEKLGWEPEYPLSKGLKETMRWIRE